VRGTGDGTWAMDKHWFNFMLYEKELNRAIEGHKIKALCAYSIARINLKNIFDVGIRHRSSLVKQAETWETLNSGHFTKDTI